MGPIRCPKRRTQCNQRCVNYMTVKAEIAQGWQYHLLRNDNYWGKAIPGQALRAPGGRGSQFSRQSAHEGGKIFSPKHRPPLPPGNIPGNHFCQRLSRPQGHRLCQWKIAMTPLRIEPATLRLIAQCPQQLLLILLILNIIVVHLTIRL
jgi:hypothetical protein